MGFRFAGLGREAFPEGHQRLLNLKSRACPRELRVVGLHQYQGKDSERGTLGVAPSTQTIQVVTLGLCRSLLACAAASETARAKQNRLPRNLHDPRPVLPAVSFRNSRGFRNLEQDFGACKRNSANPSRVYLWPTPWGPYVGVPNFPCRSCEPSSGKWPRWAQRRCHLAPSQDYFEVPCRPLLMTSAEFPISIIRVWLSAFA